MRIQKDPDICTFGKGDDNSYQAHKFAKLDPTHKDVFQFWSKAKFEGSHPEMTN